MSKLGLVLTKAKASVLNKDFARKLVCEFIGTFYLCFADGLSDPVSVTFAPFAIGGILMTMIYAGGPISGAHYNPAVTWAFWLLGDMDFFMMAAYWTVQVIASCMAGAFALWCSGTGRVGHPYFDWSFSDVVSKALVIEFFCTFALVYVVLNTARSKKVAGNSYFGLAIGWTVLSCGIWGGPISGGAFNPADGTGLPWASGENDFEIWVYWLGPLCGAATAAGVYKFLNPDEFKTFEFSSDHEMQTTEAK
jgi:aquaporin Z